MSRLPLVLAILSSTSLTRAHGGDPIEAPSHAELVDTAITTHTVVGSARPEAGLGLPEAGGELRDLGRQRVGAAGLEGVRGSGLGHVSIPERGLVGVRLAEGTEHLVFAVEATRDTAADSGYSHLGVTLLGREVGKVEWGLGQMVFNDDALAGSESIGLNIGFIRYREDVRLGGMRLQVDAHLTANLFQQTESELPLLRGLRDGIRPCATQSEIGLRLTLHVSNELALIAFGIDQDDPFHFTSGAECFGDGAVWMQSSKAGLGIDAKLGRGLVLSAGLTWATAAVGFDLETHRHGVAMSGDYRNTEVEAGLTLAFRQ